MLTSLSTNYNRRNKNVRLYELANVYLPKQLPLTELPDERMHFTLGMYGAGDFFSYLQKYLPNHGEYMDSLYLLFQTFSGNELHIVSKEVIVEIV